MKIVIAGAGEVGSHLARLLSREKQDVILIDNNAERLAILDADNNLMTLKGRAYFIQNSKIIRSRPVRPVYSRYP